MSAAISPANAQNLILRSGEDIAVQAAITSSGSLTLLAGDSVFLTSSPMITVGGSLSISVDTLGNDGGAGGVAYFGQAIVSATSIAINGAGQNDTLGGFEGVDQAVHGNGGNDTIISSGEGHYFGDAGNDLMRSGLSSGIVPEALDGGSGVDTIDKSGFNGEYILNLATGATNFDYESFTNFENVIAGGGNDRITGSAGNNTIDGGAGNDTLNGGAGADTMRGGAGDDVYIVDTAGDVADESGGDAGVDRVQSSVVSINLADAVHFKGDIEAATLTGTANLNLTGNGLANTLIGNSGNNVLNGLGGIDTMRGRAGNDVYIVDDAGDVVDESTGGGGTDRVQSSVVSIDLADASHFSGDIEAARLTGTADLNLTGNGLANTLSGNSGDNVIDGGKGSDTLDGGTGKDILSGGQGADRFVFAPGDTGQTASQADIITDFHRGQHDKIDLSAIDASTLGGIQHFTFIGAAAFSGAAGELRYRVSLGDTLVMGDTDGDKKADLVIKLTGTVALAASDFVLTPPSAFAGHADAAGTHPWQTGMLDGGPSVNAQLGPDHLAMLV